MLISNKYKCTDQVILRKKSKCLDVFFFEKEVEMRWLQFVSRQTAVVAIEVLHMTSCVCRSRAVRHIGRDNHLGSSNNNVAGCSHPPLIFLKQLIYSLSVITSWKIQVLDWKRENYGSDALYNWQRLSAWNRTVAAWGDWHCRLNHLLLVDLTHGVQRLLKGITVWKCSSHWSNCFSPWTHCFTSSCIPVCSPFTWLCDCFQTRHPRRGGHKTAFNSSRPGRKRNVMMSKEQLTPLLAYLDGLTTQR